jgi:acyl carrier protein
MKNTELVLQKIIEMVADVAECQIEEVTPDSSLPNELGIDSLMGLEILVRVEREFGIKLEEEQVLQMDTPNNIVNLIIQQEVILA